MKKLFLSLIAGFALLSCTQAVEAVTNVADCVTKAPTALSDLVAARLTYIKDTSITANCSAYKSKYNAAVIVAQSCGNDALNKALADYKAEVTALTCP